jgi:hypothetical protein
MSEVDRSVLPIRRPKFTDVPNRTAAEKGLM